MCVYHLLAPRLTPPMVASLEAAVDMGKEVVQAANTAALLGKRVILSNLGVMPALGLLPQVGCCCLPCNHIVAMDMGC